MMARSEAPIVLQSLFENGDGLTVSESMFEPVPPPQMLAFEDFSWK